MAQTFVVPTGVTQVTAAAFGAQGGSMISGLGGSATATLAGTPGETLVNVGGEGGSPDFRRP